MSVNRERRSQRHARSNERTRRCAAPQLSTLWWRPGVASDYIHHLDELIAAGATRPVVLYCRCSTEDQRQNGSLHEAMDEDIRDLRPLGYSLTKRLVAVFDGHETSSVHHVRDLFDQAAGYALRRDAILVSRSRDRFIRRASFGRGQPLTQRTECPTVPEFEELLWMARGVPLATMLHPDMPQVEVRGLQTRRGHLAKGDAGGGDRMPGYCKRVRDAVLQEVLRLAGEGLNSRQIQTKIQQAFGICKNQATIWRWLQKHG